MGHLEASQRTHRLKALGETQGSGLKTEEHTIERSELRRVNGEEITQRRDLRVAGGVRMDADGPEPALFLDRSPELLRNPGQAALKEWHARKTIGQKENPLFTQGRERVAIGAVTRSDPDVGIEAVAAQDANAFADPSSLRCSRNARKLRNVMQIDQAAAAVYA